MDTKGWLLASASTSALFLILSLLRPSSLRVRKRPIGIVATVAVGMISLSLAMSSLINALGFRETGGLAEVRKVLESLDAKDRLLALAVVAILAGAAEELFFRGAVLSGLEKFFGSTWAVWVSASLFGLVHFDLIHGFAALFMGVFLGLVVQKFKSTLPGIVAHVANNALGVLFPSFGANWGALASAAVCAAGISVFAGCAFILSRSRSF